VPKGRLGGRKRGKMGNTLNGALGETSWGNRVGNGKHKTQHSSCRCNNRQKHSQQEGGKMQIKKEKQMGGIIVGYGGGKGVPRKLWARVMSAN